MNPRRFAVAPMMRYSHRHGRMLWRLLCPPALLYTEMTVAAALARGAARTIEKALAHSPVERPLALQVAGADAAELARAAAAGEGAGFCEINLNCGCPSERAGAGGFGACMMSRPALVAECVAAMKAAVSIPITVKCRLALDRRGRAGDGRGRNTGAGGFRRRLRRLDCACAGGGFGRA